MTVYATGTIGYGGGPGTSVDLSPPSYLVNFSVFGTDGTTIFNSSTALSSSLRIPLGTSAKKADSIIRDAMVSALATAGLPGVDPNDIYIPFSG